MCGGIVLETNHAEILNRMQEQNQIAKSYSDVCSYGNTKNSSNISTKLISGVKAGSSFIASVVPSTINSAREWASNLPTSAPSLRISNRTGFHDLGEASSFHAGTPASDTKESEKICL